MPAQRATPSRRRILVARCLAIAVDLLQIVVFPLFGPGAASPADDALDVATAGAMIGLVGWHWSFLPSFLSELVPYLDFVPTWTAAVFLATRRRSGAPAAGSIGLISAPKQPNKGVS